MLDTLLKIVFYGHVGLLIEIWFTGIHNLVFEKDLSARGRTYLWMIPTYGFGGFILGLLRDMITSKVAFVLIAIIFIYATEFLVGWSLRKIIGKCPWDYGSARFGIAGLVRLDYAPWWTIAVTLFVLLSSHIEAVLSRFIERVL